MPSKQRLEIGLLLLASVILLNEPTYAQVSISSPAATRAKATQKPEGVAARVSAIVASGRLADLRWSNFSNYQAQLISFYRPFGYQPAWVRDGQPNRTGR